MKDRYPAVRTATRRTGDTPLLWITGCTVGVAQPCADSVATALAWQQLESACATASRWENEGVASTGSES